MNGLPCMPILMFLTYIIKIPVLVSALISFGDFGRPVSLLLLSRLQSGSPKGTCNQKNKRKIVLE
jgi:hypothetical protein